LTTPSTTYTFPANFTSYSSSGTWYEIPDGSVGAVTLSATSPSDVFYIYNSGNMNLQNISFELSGNAQSYNIYFLSGGVLTLSGVCYGNFLANQVIVVGSATVYGSVSALTSTIGGDALTVYMGCPQYNFTYAAIAAYLIEAVIINGGKYGAPTIVDSDTSNSTPGVDYVDELTNLNTFVGELGSFLGNTIYQSNAISGTTDILPISSNNYYTFLSTSTPIVLTFQPVTANDVFYIFTTLGVTTNFKQVSFNLNSVSPENIYIYCDESIVLSSSTTNYGNFIAHLSMFGSTSGGDGDTAIIGTVSAISNTTYSTAVSNYETYKTTINFPVTPCFMKGTKILTDRWYVPIEELKVGDLVMTHGEISVNGLLRDANTPRKISNIRIHKRKAGLKTSPIVITKNTFAPNMPFEDLYVSRNHRMIDRKGRLYPASKYVNGNTIYQDPSIETITYYHIELASHYAITANGVMVESYNTPPRLRPICAPPNAPQ
jgi:hypothetical protein